MSGDGKIIFNGTKMEPATFIAFNKDENLEKYNDPDNYHESYISSNYYHLLFCPNYVECFIKNNFTLPRKP